MHQITYNISKSTISKNSLFWNWCIDGQPYSTVGVVRVRYTNIENNGTHYWILRYSTVNCLVLCQIWYNLHAYIKFNYFTVYLVIYNIYFRFVYTCDMCMYDVSLHVHMYIRGVKNRFSHSIMHDVQIQAFVSFQNKA